jgi:hypothetical protein
VSLRAKQFNAGRASIVVSQFQLPLAVTKMVSIETYTSAEDRCIARVFQNVARRSRLMREARAKRDGRRFPSGAQI